MASNNQPIDRDPFFPNQIINQEPQNNQNWLKLARVTWRVFLATRRIIQKHKKRGWQACVTWQLDHAIRQFLSGTQKNTTNNMSCLAEFEGPLGGFWKISRNYEINRTGKAQTSKNTYIIQN